MLKDPKICDKAVMIYPCSIKLAPNEITTPNNLEYVIKLSLLVLLMLITFLIDIKFQEIWDNIVSKDTFMLKFCHDK